MKQATITFRQLVDREWIARGLTHEFWLSKLHTESGVCKHTLRAAYAGTLIQGASALKLRSWCEAYFPKVTLDVAALTTAPTKAQKAG